MRNILIIDTSMMLNKFLVLKINSLIRGGDVVLLINKISSKNKISNILFFLFINLAFKIDYLINKLIYKFQINDINIENLRSINKILIFEEYFKRSSFPITDNYIFLGVPSINSLTIIFNKISTPNILFFNYDNNLNFLKSSLISTDNSLSPDLIITLNKLLGFTNNTLSAQTIASRAAIRSKLLTINIARIFYKISDFFDPQSYLGRISADLIYFDVVNPDEEVSYYFIIRYIYSILNQTLFGLFRLLLPKRNLIWSILISSNNSSAVISPRHGHLVADPFIFNYGDMNYVFAEDYSFHEKSNSIVLYEVSQKLEIKFLGKVMSSTNGLSYPHIFRDGKNLFAICESSDFEIKTFKCIDFPKIWVPTNSIMKRPFRSESNAIVHRDGYWYLFMSPDYLGDGDFDTRLDLYVTRNLWNNSWKKHSQNPLLIGTEGSRTGGLFWRDGILHRVGRCWKFGVYGYQIKIFRIDVLTPDLYEETYLTTYNPENFYDDIGSLQIHHLYESLDLVAFDFKHST